MSKKVNNAETVDLITADFLYNCPYFSSDRSLVRRAVDELLKLGYNFTKTNTFCVIDLDNSKISEVPLSDAIKYLSTFSNKDYKLFIDGDGVAYLQYMRRETDSEHYTRIAGEIRSRIHLYKFYDKSDEKEAIKKQIKELQNKLKSL